MIIISLFMEHVNLAWSRYLPNVFFKSIILISRLILLLFFEYTLCQDYKRFSFLQTKKVNCNSPKTSRLFIYCCRNETCYLPLSWQNEWWYEKIAISFTCSRAPVHNHVRVWRFNELIKDNFHAGHEGWKNFLRVSEWHWWKKTFSFYINL